MTTVRSLVIYLSTALVTTRFIDQFEVVVKQCIEKGVSDEALPHSVLSPPLPSPAPPHPLYYHDSSAAVIPLFLVVMFEVAYAVHKRRSVKFCGIVFDVRSMLIYMRFSEGVNCMILSVDWKK